MQDPHLWIRHFEANKRGKDFVVGDLHGCLDELLNLLAHAGFNPKRDRLFSVGDLVDRGERSADCLGLLDKPWFFAVRGNHEQMLLDHWREPQQTPAFDPGWLQSARPDQIADWARLISALPYVIKVGQGEEAFYLMHAELWENSALLTAEMVEQARFKDPLQARSKALWSRHIISSHWRGSAMKFHSPQLPKIFCGHTIVQMPMIVERAIYLDTGAFAPFVDPATSNAEHFGLSLVEADSLLHWFAPTCAQYRGSVVQMGQIIAELSPSASRAEAGLDSFD